MRCIWRKQHLQGTPLWKVTIAMMAPASGYRTCRTQHRSCHSSEAHQNSSRTRCMNDDGPCTPRRRRRVRRTQHPGNDRRRRNFSARCPSSERGRSHTAPSRLLICTASVYKVIRTAVVAIHWMPFFIFVKHCGCPVGITFFCWTRTLWLHSRAHFFLMCTCLDSGACWRATGGRNRGWRVVAYIYCEKGRGLHWSIEIHVKRGNVFTGKPLGRFEWIVLHFR